MNKILITIMLVLLSTLAIADNSTISAPTIINWVSRDTMDEVTINNGTGTPINVVITVRGSVDDKLPGISIRNCGATNHIDAGSSAICGSSDANNPVMFSSDSGSEPASGTYEIKPRS